MRSFLLMVLATLLAAASATAQTGAPADARGQAIQRASDAVVGVQVMAVDDARSAATLGRARQGSGVVIADDGLVLTIGYLVLEAEQVRLVTDDARVIPARVVAYDLATGFGLVQALAPLRLSPVPLGSAARLADEELLLIASGGQGGSLSAARLMSRRGFSGYWEYHIDGALFTAPARSDHSGAGLFNQHGELVGIGSLVVAEAMGPGAGRLPGNMFVPIDLLKPILAELKARGASSQSTRAWIGVNCVEQGGQVRVVRVNEDSPADVAGVAVGDRIVRIDGVEVQQLETLWKTLWRGAASERTVVLEIVRQGQPMTLNVQSVDRSMTLRRPKGV